jgi:hypothetical protein
VSDPYRDAGHRDGTDAPRDRGIVGDVISQFADPFAFYRELVQNAIDAGTSEVTIEIAHDATQGRVHVSVRDRGDGMTRDIIENQLLVLFRSTKEKDRTKIGKFGIGFSSVLAQNPDVVVISTVRDGKRLLVHLYRDLSYELFDGGRATQQGTTVELQLAMQPGQVASFRAASEQALRKWCRHASVPIELVYERSTVRIDRPLEIDDAVVQVMRTTDGGQLAVVAGITASPQAYTGFFNHGLMLVESAQPVRGHVAVKIQDARLGHTLSRDDVRRDAHHARAVAFAREAIDALEVAIGNELRHACEQRDAPRYREIVEAVLASDISPRPWAFPLLEPRGGSYTASVGDLGRRAWGAARRSQVSTALAATGAAIVDTTHAAVVVRALEHAASISLGHVESELTAVEPVELDDRDHLLVSALAAILDKAHRAPSAIVLVELAGAREDLVSVGLPSRDTRLFDRDDAVKNPFAFFGRRTLALTVGHPLVEAARQAEDVTLAASHLARAILLRHGLLDAERSQRVLAYVLDSLGVER